MTQELVTYLFVGIIAIFVILSFAIGLEKMIKIILGNYILGGICFAASLSIDLIIKISNNDNIVNFLNNSKSFIVLILYFLLLFLIYHRSKISIDIPTDPIMQKSLYLFFVPLTVLSMCLTLEIILLGTSIVSQSSLLSSVNGFTKNVYLQKFIINTPFWILIHGIATIIITSELKTRIKTDIV